MIYAFFDIGGVTDEVFARWLSETPKFRREKIMRYRFRKDRVLSLCAYRLLCAGAGRVIEAFREGEHGKPYIPDGGPYFNITHCGGCVAAAISDCEIGVDAETVRPHPSNVIPRVFTAGEIAQIEGASDRDDAFFTFWTLKESYIKATGRGLSFPLMEVEFTLRPDGVICSDERFVFTTDRVRGQRISACAAKKQQIHTVDIPQLDALWTEVREN